MTEEEINKEIEHLGCKYAMDETFSEKESLADKIFDSKLCLGDDISKIFAKYVKEKIQNAQRRLKEEFDKNDWESNTLDVPENRNPIIDKIFLEEFGKEILK